MCFVMLQVLHLPDIEQLKDLEMIILRAHLKRKKHQPLFKPQTFFVSV